MEENKMSFLEGDEKSKKIKCHFRRVMNGGKKENLIFGGKWSRPSRHLPNTVCSTVQTTKAI